MKFTLKDYQEDAVRTVLQRLRRARRDWRDDRERSAFALTAATGAGKTVMAAAALEALFLGSDEWAFDRDPGAVVIWFSDDPSLNEQTRIRLLQASDRLDHGRLVVVENSFAQPRFEPGKVYFLNTQKLSGNSLLVRGHEPVDAEPHLPLPRPDMRSHTIYDTIRNTIDDPSLTLYLVLDEAHRGMRETRGERPTIIRRLINGGAGVPAMPIVWGISATIQRFTDAMQGAENRTLLPNVEVSTAKVQDSGLLKDVVILDVPDESGQFETVWMRRAADKLRELDAAWIAYAHAQGVERVVPLLVLQVPNTPDPAQVGEWLDIVFRQFPNLPRDSIANVFGEHRTETFGGHQAPYVAPELVQDRDWVRILVAKDAISTGWDCPRAEVMVSFRPAVDRTHITQLLGRMVRTPMARRVPGNDRLNAVDCLLPHFDRATLDLVVRALTQGAAAGDDRQPGVGRALVNPVDMLPNPAMPQAVWDLFGTLPTQLLPRRGGKPTKRLTALAQALSADGVRAGAYADALARMCAALDGARAQYAAHIATARADVTQVDGVALAADLRTGERTLQQFYEAADFAAVDEVYRRARRTFSPAVVQAYVDHLTADRPRDDVEALQDAHTVIAAMGLVDAVAVRLDGEAEALADAWFGAHRVDIGQLGDERRGAYAEIKGLSREPKEDDLRRPHLLLEPTTIRTAAGDVPIARFAGHLFCDADGLYPAELKTWEAAVLDKESARGGFVGWYRNPSRSNAGSLAIAYADGDDHRLMRPDFLFFRQRPDGAVVADIVDPHGTFLADALPKLKGLAAYADRLGGRFGRIEAVAMIDGVLRVLDMQDAAVRAGVRDASDAAALYAGALAVDY